MKAEKQAEIIIVGAGPVALFAVFQLGLFGFKCHLIDAFECPGGQCRMWYPDKPIFDVPGFSSITGEELIDRLLDQIAPYNPVFHGDQVVKSLNETISGIGIATDKGMTLNADAVVIASGLGALATDGGVVRPDPTTMWGLERKGNAIAVDTETFATSRPRVFAIGDACQYPGKLKLILSGFHEAAMMTQTVRRTVSQNA
nr:NAD(P)-binding protein [Ochrobactrum sp. CM-21-5]